MIDRKHIYSLEFIRSEMELKLHEAKINNPYKDYSDAENKIKRLSDAVGCMYELFENIEQFNRKRIELEWVNKKLMSNI